jgi:hypothetical protein
MMLMGVGVLLLGVLFQLPWYVLGNWMLGEAELTLAIDRSAFANAYVRLLHGLSVVETKN